MHYKSINLLLQICHREVMQWSTYILQLVEDESEKNSSNIPLKTTAQIAQWIEQP